MRRPRVAAASAAGVLASLLTGCGMDVSIPQTAPTCEAGGRHVSRAVVLMAQAVRTAQLIPCVVLLPAGWTVRSFTAESGSASFSLDSDRAGQQALVVTLRRSCTTAGATVVPTDEAGTARYERVLTTEPDLRDVRYYRFTGGCATYEFHIRGDQRAAPANEASLAVGFVGRAQVDDQVRSDSDGRLTLDPTPGDTP